MSRTILSGVKLTPLQSPTLSPMVYTVLQLVARAKETGISAVDVSNKTGYDSKNCAYLIKQLQEMDLVYGRFHRNVDTL